MAEAGDICDSKQSSESLAETILQRGDSAVSEKTLDLDSTTDEITAKLADTQLDKPNNDISEKKELQAEVDGAQVTDEQPIKEPEQAANEAIDEKAAVKEPEQEVQVEKPEQAANEAIETKEPEQEVQMGIKDKKESEKELYNIYDGDVKKGNVPNEVLLSDFEAEKKVSSTVNLTFDDSEISDDDYTRNRCIEAYGIPEGSDIEDHGLQPVIYKGQLSTKTKKTGLMYSLNKFIAPTFSINNLHMLNNELMSYITTKSTAPTRAKQRESNSSWDSLVNVLLTQNAKGSEGDKKKALSKKKAKSKGPTIENVLTSSFAVPDNMCSMFNTMFNTKTKSKK